MARLNATRRNPDVFRDGEWIELDDPEFEGAAIRTRGFTDEYTDARNRATRAATRRHGDDIPAAVSRNIVIDAFLGHSLVDVRGFEDDDGRPITLDDFKAALRDQPAQIGLYIAVITAAAKAGERRAEEVKAAAGN